MRQSFLHIFISIILLMCLFVPLGYSAIVDTYNEDFDERTDDTTLNGVDSWSVYQGTASNAITQNSTTYSGSGKALQLVGATPIIGISRSATYGAISPCWVEFIVKPGIGAQAVSLPSSKIFALSFDYRGKIYASDGSSWRDTGKTFSAGEWYRVIFGLDFKTHLYDVYIEPVTVPKVAFIPDVENLNFISSSINSLNKVAFEGVYCTTQTDDTYIDDLVVHFIDRLEIITPSQTIIEDYPSTPIVVQLQNSNSETQTAWRDITLELKSSSEKGQFSLDKDNWSSISQIIMPEGSQALSFYYRDSDIGKPIITVKEYPDRGWEEGSQQENIVAKTAYFDVLVTSPQVAGEYFSMDIIAMDDQGEVDEFYNGGLEISIDYISPSAGTLKITPETASGFTKGKLELNAQYPDCGIIEIKVQDKDEPTNVGVSGDILFLPSSLTVSAGTTQVVSRSFKLKVGGIDSQGSLCPNYKGPAGLSIAAVSPGESSGKILPVSISAGDFSNGFADIAISYDRWGIIKIEAYDLNYPGKTGTSEDMVFQPGGLLIDIASPSSGGRDFYYIGESIGISVSVVDELKWPIPNYQGTIDISSTLGLGLPEKYQFTEIDAGRHTFFTSVSSPGSYEVSAEEKASQLTAKAPKFEVKGAVLEVVPTVAAVGTAEVIIKLLDDEGNIISSESELGVVVQLQEEYEDSSSSSSASMTPVSFKNGIARILVSDTQPEIVTILPSSTFDFKVKKGSVTFGRISKTGIGGLLWREIKEKQ